MAQKLTEFDLPIAQSALDIEDKTRSNIFTWRGQFSPQLIESLLFAYCPRNATVLDPFVGSGTVLYEAACFGLPAFGYEVNPAAWILSRIYGFANLESNKRSENLNSVRDKLENYFPRLLLFDAHSSKEVDLTNFHHALSNIYSCVDNHEKAIIDALVILLDLENSVLTVDRIHHTFSSLCQVINNLPYSELPILSSLCDARSLPLEEDSIDFVITSPPYINVFNYHQNYRRSAEALG
ncbi:MAG: DNA methyltransferase [Nostocaceae cyanobacterium]|nr:DNA methyltransferase [Nostocaceae cyanobacterium]